MLYCAPDKEMFFCYRDARRAARRIHKQAGYSLTPYRCGEHLHLTKVQIVGTTVVEPIRTFRRSRFLNRPARLRRVA